MIFSPARANCSAQAMELLVKKLSRLSFSWQQMAMQYVVYIDKAPTAFLPASGNRQSWEATPQFDETIGLLVEPQPPYTTIGIMHNAQADKNLGFTVKTRQGNVLQGTMR